MVRERGAGDFFFWKEVIEKIRRKKKGGCMRGRKRTHLRWAC